MHKLGLPVTAPSRQPSYSPDCLSFCLPSSESLKQCDIQCDSIQEFPTPASLGNLQGAADKAMPGSHCTQTSLLRGWGVGEYGTRMCLRSPGDSHEQPELGTTDADGDI